MEAKLTLKFEKSAIDDLKNYAKEQGTSVSRLIEEYAKKLTKEKSKPSLAEEPFPEWLQNIHDITSKYPPTTKTDVELKRDYNNYLEKKYQ